jgi:peptide chain release factor subunit 1
MSASLTHQERDALLTRFDEITGNGSLSLLTRSRFNDLASLECREGPVVSLYLDLGPQKRHNNAWEIDLKTLARDTVAATEGREQRAVVEAQLDRMARWVHDRIADLGRGVAIFSCPTRDVWWQISLPLSLPPRLRVAARPYLRPLARIRDEHARFAVVTLDKQRARLFVSQHGGIQEVADLFENTPGHHKQGGWSQMRFQRHHDSHVMWHAGAVAHAAELLLDRFGARHLLASGTPEVLAEFRAALTPAMRDRWAGEFGQPIEASAADVAEAIAPLQQDVERTEELRAIDRINDAVSSGRGVWGLEKTLDAVSQQKVMTLVVHDRYRAPGSECSECRLLLRGEVAHCPGCGRPAAPVEDLVDALLERAVTQEAELELVRSDQARAKLPVGEPVGALLRY